MKKNDLVLIGCMIIILTISIVSCVFSANSIRKAKKIEKDVTRIKEDLYVDETQTNEDYYDITEIDTENSEYEQEEN